MTQLPAFQAYQLAFSQHIRDPKSFDLPENSSPRGMAVYREIVFYNIEGSVAACFPVLKAVLGENDWLGLVREFVIQHACGTPIFREIPEEFLSFLNQLKDLPPYVQSLAHYEWVELYLAYLDESVDALNVDVNADLLDGLVVFNPALALLSYDYPVHQISPEFIPTLALETPIHFLVFRNEQDEVKFVELNSMTAALIADLQQGELTPRQALIGMASMLDFEVQAFVSFGLGLLNDLKAQGAILGVALSP